MHEYPRVPKWLLVLILLLLTSLWLPAMTCFAGMLWAAGMVWAGSVGMGTAAIVPQWVTDD